MTVATALFVLAAAASAGQTSVAVRYREGNNAYTKEFKLEDWKSFIKTGLIRESGKPPRQFIVSFLGGASPIGLHDLQYQLEFSRMKGGNGPVVQVQGEVFLKEGVPIRVLDCGDWTIDVGLAPLGDAAPDQATALKLGHQRVTVAFADRGARWLCRRTVVAGIEAGFALSRPQDAAFLSFSLKTVEAAGSAEIKFSVEHTVGKGATPYGLKGRQHLVPGERTDVADSVGRLGLLFEGTEAAWDTAERHGKKDPKGGDGSPPEPPKVALGEAKYRRFQDDFVAFDLPTAWSVVGASDDPQAGYGFQLRPPGSRDETEAYMAWFHLLPYDPAKKAPEKDYARLLAESPRLVNRPAWHNDGSGQRRTLRAPVQEKVTGGWCGRYLDENVDHECEDLSLPNRIARGRCFSVMHHLECISEKGVWLSAHSNLGFYHDRPGELADDEKNSLEFAERRAKSFEFRGAVPKNAFARD